MKRFFILIILSLCGSKGFTQEHPRTITGLITRGDDRVPVEGATVRVKGTKNVSGSQSDGIYYISITNRDSVLVISHPLFQSREIRLEGHESEYNVDLKRAGQ